MLEHYKKGGPHTERSVVFNFIQSHVRWRGLETSAPMRGCDCAIRFEIQISLPRSSRIEQARTDLSLLVGFQVLLISIIVCVRRGEGGRERCIRVEQIAPFLFFSSLSSFSTNSRSSPSHLWLNQYNPFSLRFFLSIPLFCFDSISIRQADNEKKKKKINHDPYRNPFRDHDIRRKSGSWPKFWRTLGQRRKSSNLPNSGVCLTRCPSITIIDTFSIEQRNSRWLCWSDRTWTWTRCKNCAYYPETDSKFFQSFLKTKQKKTSKLIITR